MHANLQCPPPRQACAWPASCPPKLGARLAREARAALYLECSALTRHGVQQLFHDAVDNRTWDNRTWTTVDRLPAEILHVS